MTGIRSKQVYIVASCLLSLIRRNSVLEELRVKRFAVIQEEICSSVVEHRHTEGF